MRRIAALFMLTATGDLPDIKEINHSNCYPLDKIEEVMAGVGQKPILMGLNDQFRGKQMDIIFYSPMEGTYTEVVSDTVTGLACGLRWGQYGEIHLPPPRGPKV